MNGARCSTWQPPSPTPPDVGLSQSSRYFAYPYMAVDGQFLPPKSRIFSKNSMLLPNVFQHLPRFFAETL